MQTLGRRSLVGMLLVYAGLTLAVVAASGVHACLGRRAPAAERLERAPSAELLKFLGPVAAGGAVGRWTVHEVGPLRNGNLRVELRAGAERVALTVTRGGPGPTPVATSTGLAIFPAVHDLEAYTPTPATREAAELLAGVLGEREAEVGVPEDLRALHR